MGRLGKAALADPTDQRSSWLAVNRPVNSGAYVLTLGLWEAKIALTAQADGVGARRQHMISVLLTLALWSQSEIVDLSFIRSAFSRHLWPFLSIQSQLTIYVAHVNGLSLPLKWRKFLILTVRWGQTEHFLWSHISALMFSQCSAFWAEAANPFDCIPSKSKCCVCNIAVFFGFFFINQDNITFAS